MTEQTTILHLVLDRLGLGNSIATIDDRIAIQKAVCLIQEAGLQLGYSYNWYVRGPYSPALASDYYQLAGDGAANPDGLVLTPFAVGVVTKVESVFNTPPNVPLTRVHWLELLASIVFLKKRYRLTDEAVRAKIAASKPNLLPYFENALPALRQAGFAI